MILNSRAAAAKELRTDEKEFHSTVLKLLQPGRTLRVTNIYACLNVALPCRSSFGFGDGGTVLSWGSVRAEFGDGR